MPRAVDGFHPNKAVGDNVLLNNDMIRIQIDAQRSVFNDVALNLSQATDSWGRHKNGRSLVPVIYGLWFPRLPTRQKPFRIVLLDKLSQPVLLLNFQRRQKFVFNNSIALNLSLGT